MRPVDVRVHRRETIAKTLGYKALCREVIALVKFHLAYDVKNAGIALKTCGMQRNVIQQVFDTGKPCLLVLECYATQEAMYLVAHGKKVFGKIAAVLSGDAGDECSFCH